MLPGLHGKEEEGKAWRRLVRSACGLMWDAFVCESGDPGDFCRPMNDSLKTIHFSLPSIRVFDSLFEPERRVIAMAVELLEGEILDEYRSVVDTVELKKKKKKVKEEEKTAGSPCSEVLICSQEGCTGATTDQKKKKKQARVAGWFDPPAA
jgi:hypothetical protein